MPEFKCISCGKSVEQEKQCTCPHCGYTMYELPYDRAVLLRKEIIRFVMTVSGQTANIKLLIWGTKSEDDKRFPDFGKIQAYACTAQKTELFLSRVSESIEKIRQHIHTPFQKKYRAETKFLQEWSDDVKDQLADGESLLSYYKRLILIRKANPEIARGEYTALSFSGVKLGGFVSTWNGKTVCVLHNPSGNAISVDLSAVTDARFTELAAVIGMEDATFEGTTVTLGGSTSCVLR